MGVTCFKTTSTVPSFSEVPFCVSFSYGGFLFRNCNQTRMLVVSVARFCLRQALLTWRLTPGNGGLHGSLAATRRYDPLASELLKLSAVRVLLHFGKAPKVSGAHFGKARRVSGAQSI